MEERIMRTVTTIAATLGVIGAIVVGSAVPAAAWYGYGYYPGYYGYHHRYYGYHHRYYGYHHRYYGYYPHYYGYRRWWGGY
jgi:hypothetical protein